MAKKKSITRATSNDEGEDGGSSSDEDDEGALRSTKYSADPASSASDESDDGGGESDDSQESSNGKEGKGMTRNPKPKTITPKYTGRKRGAASESAQKQVRKWKRETMGASSSSSDDSDSDNESGDNNNSDSDAGENEHGKQHPNNHLHAKARPPMSPLRSFTFWSEYIVDDIYFDSESFNKGDLMLPVSIDMLTSGTIVKVADPNGSGFLKGQVTIDEDRKQPSDPTEAMVRINTGVPLDSDEIPVSSICEILSCDTCSCK